MPISSPYAYLIYTIVGNASLLLDFLVNTFVIACLMVTPAFSVSFLESPVVIQILRAGWSFQSSSLPLLDGDTGMLLRRVMRTPLASDCRFVSYQFFVTQVCSVPRQRILVALAPALLYSTSAN